MQNRSDYIRKFLWLLIFGLAMGLMEAVIAVYLRALFFPEGFEFPLRDLPSRLFFYEWIRELCTLVMLVAIAFVSGGTRRDRFAFFLFSFAVWDIFYYAGLKWLTGWPESLLTWDLLFLIPVPWFGPVLAPLLSSVAMIGLALFITGFQEGSGVRSILSLEWRLLITGAFVLFLSFIWSFLAYLLQTAPPGNVSGLCKSPEWSILLSEFVPGRFPWPIFLPGVLFVFVGAANIARRTLK